MGKGRRGERGIKNSGEPQMDKKDQIFL